MGADRWTPFRCTPPLLFAIAPFAAAPFATAALAWTVATGAIWLLVARRLAPGAFGLVAVYPGALVNMVYGQTGWLTGALFAGAMLALETRPYLAGALLGALVVKPHLALLAPLALLAAGERKAFAAAAVSAAGLLALSGLVFGKDALLGFLGATSGGVGWLSNLSPLLLVMPTAYGLFGTAAGPTMALVGQLAFSLGAAALTWIAWSRPYPISAKAGVLALCTVLATPYLFHYDLAFLLLAFLWLAQGAPAMKGWERAVLIAFYLIPLLGWFIAWKWHVMLTFEVVMLGAWLAVRQLQREPIERRTIPTSFAAVGAPNS